MHGNVWHYCSCHRYFKKRGKTTLLKYFFILNGILAGAAVLTDIISGNPTHIVVFISLGIWCISFPVITILIGYWIKHQNAAMELTDK